VPIPTILSLKEMRQLSWRWKSEKLRIGFIPTMGALHEGHFSLVQHAQTMCERIVVSIFVNPLQFGPNEDFARYPRTLAKDLESLSQLNVHAVFSPTTNEMYPNGFQTSVSNKEMSRHLCGAFRHGHFDGVLTVVNKLFNSVSPDVAVFGKKDYQQWRLIQQMVRDLNMPIDVVGVDTLREPDGLAMSSRNRYLAAEQRAQAMLIFQGLNSAKAAWSRGQRQRAELINAFVERVNLCPDMKIQYAEIVNAVDLKPIDDQCSDDISPVMIVAVLYGDVRLIDNLELGEANHG